MGKEKLSIYSINSSSKNRLEKVQELEIGVSFVYPLNDYILVKKDDAFIVYDADFDLLIKEEEPVDLVDYRVMKIDENRMLIASSKGISLWDLEKEERTFLKM